MLSNPYNPQPKGLTKCGELGTESKTTCPSNVGRGTFLQHTFKYALIDKQHRPSIAASQGGNFYIACLNDTRQIWS